MEAITVGASVVGLLGLSGLGLWWLTASRRPRGRAAAPTPAVRPARPPAVPPQAPAASVTAPAEPAPAELAAFTPRRLDELPKERQAAYRQVFKDVPRPPRLLHHLLSPAFFDGASSAQLVELISAEPLIAARVLATVNSAAYGLSRPVTAIGQAVTHLGLNQVRSLCVQHIMRTCFMVDRAERQPQLEATWAASALASELTQRLGLALGVDDRGGLVSAVVLSFLGRLATQAHTPMGILETIPPRNLLARTTAEERQLGLCAAEIGRLLMTAWELPPSVVADAADLDRVLVQPTAGDARGQRLALGYLCARLGERMAHGELPDLAAFDLAADRDAECFHLRALLGTPPLTDLPARLCAPDLLQAMQRLRTALKV